MLNKVIKNNDGERLEYMVDEENRRQGRAYRYSDDILICESEYIDDKIHGLARIYNTDDGKLEKEENYVHGIIHGPKYAYYSTGEIMASATFVDGQRKGPVCIYNIDGTIKTKILD